MKTQEFSGILCFSEKLCPLSQSEVKNLKNTVWKTPFGTVRGGQCRRHVAHHPPCIFLAQLFWHEQRVGRLGL